MICTYVLYLHGHMSHCQEVFFSVSHIMSSNLSSFVLFWSLLPY